MRSLCKHGVKVAQKPKATVEKAARNRQKP